MKTVIEEQSVKARVSGLPVFEADGQEWEIVSIRATYLHANDSRSASSHWSAVAASVGQPEDSDRRVRVVDENFGVTPEAIKLIEGIVRDNNPRDIILSLADKTWELNEATAKVFQLLGETAQEYNNLIDRIEASMPKCWGDTEEEIMDYVDSLTSGSTPGHVEGCRCL